MTAEELALDALNRALKWYETPCADDPSFTADRLTESERALCELACARCLVSNLCEGYAKAAGVTAGFWSGHSYTSKGRAQTTPRGDSDADH